MTSFINQTIASELIDDRIRAAQDRRLRRDLRQARRTARAAERSTSDHGAGGSSTRVSWVRRLGLAAAAR
jgi:hypothetical protein